MGVNIWSDVIVFESKTISFELWGSLGIPRPAPSMKNFSALGAGPHSSKLRLIVLLSNRITSDIQAHFLQISRYNWTLTCNLPTNCILFK